MTDKMTPDVTDDDRRLAREWAKSVESDPDFWGLQQRTVARVILDAVPAPTMAEMTPEERHECRWMQCDAGPLGLRGVIVSTGEWAVYVVDKRTGMHSNYSPDLVIPRPDLPHFEWPDTDQENEDEAPVKVGDVIESADDPRIAALPVGSILLDSDNDSVTKQSEGWAGLGYQPTPNEGDNLGPWKVVHIEQE